MNYFPTISLLGLVALIAGGAAPAPAPLDANLRAFLRAYAGRFGETDLTARASVAVVDLNGDGAAETLVYLRGRSLCGTGGCPLLVLARKGAAYEIVSDISVVHTPIGVLSRRSHGWRHLAVTVGGGGVPTPYTAELPFDGRRYPYNPTMAPAKPVRRPRETVVFSGENLGAPLYPQVP